MKTQTSIIAIFTIIACIQAIQAQCPAQLDLNGIQAGHFVLSDLTHNDPNTPTDVISFKEYSVVLQNPLNNAKILVALGEISVLSSAIDLFDINIISKSQLQFTLGFIYEPIKWSKISYRYLVNNRSDLNFQMITLSSVTFKSSDNNYIIAETELDQPLFNFKNYEVLSFIRGLKYQNNELIDHSLTVSIVDDQLTEKSVIFNISATTNSAKITLELLSVSYLYFEPKHVSYASFGGLVSRSSYVGKSQVDILHVDLPTNLNWLYGLTAIDISGNEIEISSSINGDAFFILDVSVPTNKIEFTYFSVAKRAGQVCENCLDKILSGSSCVKKCNQNEIYYFFKDASRACLQCPENLLADSQHKQCIGAGGDQFKVAGSYKKIASYQQSEAYTPVKPNQNRMSQEVERTDIPLQAQVKYLQEAELPYLSQIGRNQVGQVSMEQSEFMKPSREQFERFNYCNRLQNSYWTGESCQCIVGFKLSNALCVGIDEISQNNIINRQQQILQFNNTHLDSNLPEDNQNIDLNHLQKTSSTNNSQNFFCSVDNETFNPLTQQCQCKEGFGYKVNQTSNQYICVICSDFEGFYLDSGSCQDCGPNQIFDNEKQICQCKNGFAFGQNKTCNPIVRSPIAVNNETVKNGSNQQKQSQGSGDIRIQEGEEEAQNNTVQPTTERRRDRSEIASNIYPTITSDSASPTKQTDESTTPHTTIPPPTDIPANVSNPQMPTDLDLSQNQTEQIHSQTNSSSTKTQNLSQEATVPTTQLTTSTPSPAIPAPIESPETPDPTSNPASSPVSTQPPVDCMKLMRTPQINAANIYISLELLSEKKFRSQDEMQNFLKQQFQNDSSKPSSVYCIQSDVSLKQFDCLLLYPAGVPNKNFDIKFWFNDTERKDQCSLNVQVNPLQSAAKSMRSLRRR